MFFSIPHTWRSSSAEGGLSDVKELIPEFFYMPDMLMNKNNFDMGTTQDGRPIGDVILPPWAKGDPRTFIRLHRRALESEYVSEHLHEWVDLIFGYKQRGKEAEAAQNVYYYLTYEGVVDINAIADPMVKLSTIAQINNFGQTPHQLFTRPHPARKKTSVSVSVASHAQFLRPSVLRTMRGSVSDVYWQSEKGMLLCTEGKKLLLPPKFQKYVAWGFPDHSLRFCAYKPNSSASAANSGVSSSQRAGDEILGVYESLHDGQITCCAVTDDGKYIVTGGEDSVVSVWRLSHKHTRTRRRLQIASALCGHSQAISCLVSSSSYNILVSGSLDCEVIVWDLSRLILVRRLPHHPAPVTAIAIDHVTGDIVTCAGNHLFVWTVIPFRVLQFVMFCSTVIGGC